MDDYRYLKPDNATRSGRRCNGLVYYDALGDARQPGSRVDLRRLRHYPPGTPRDVRATGGDREEGCVGRAFEDADAAPRAPHCARIIPIYQKV